MIQGWLCCLLMLVKNGSYEPVRKENQYWFSSDPFYCGMTISAGLLGNPNPASKANAAVMRISHLGVSGADFELSQVTEWAIQDAALTALCPIGRLFRPSVARPLHNCRSEAGHLRVHYPRLECFWPIDALDLAEQSIRNLILIYED